MTSGAYKRTARHKKILRKSLEAARRVSSKLPKTEKQLVAAGKSIKIAQRASLKSPKHANTEVFREAVRRNSERGRRASFRARKHKNGICEICKRHCFVYKDHEHETGQKRGKLCFGCNIGLGNFKDSRRILRKAIRYLDRWKKGNKP